MKRSCLASAAVIGLAVVPWLGCGQGGSPDTLGNTAQAATVASTPLPQTEVHTVLTYPKDAQLLELALAASGTLNIRNGVRVLSSAGYGAVSNMGAGATSIGNDVQVGVIQSMRTPSVGARTVHGEITDPSKIQPPRLVNLDVTYPAASAPTAWLEPNETKSLDPGRYATIRVPRAATVKLRAGTYFAEVLEFDAGSRLEIDTSAGTVVVFARTRMKWEGTVSAPSGQTPDWLLIYTGTEQVPVLASFEGAIMAPSAAVSFQGTPAEHRGVFLARDVNVEANQRIVLKPMKTVLMALDPTSCSLQVPLPSGLTGDAREIAYQLDIARYCTARNTNADLSRVEALAKNDRTKAAAEVALGEAEPNVYLGVNQDRTRKVDRAREDGDYAKAVALGPDADGDLIPDKDDVCPGTPSLTPTDDQGCPTPLPEGPPGDQVREALAGSWIAVNNTCSTGTIRSLVTPGAFFWPTDASKGVFWVTSRARDQGSGCAIWYEIEIEGETRDGKPAHLSVIFPQVTGQTDDLVGMSGRPVPAEFIQFQALPTDTGMRGQLANDLKPYRGRFRARAMNSAGVRSPWTEWRHQTPRDCRSLGFTCGD